MIIYESDEVERIAHLVTIVIGISMYIFGLIGNSLNIFVFTIWSRSRKQINEFQSPIRVSNSSLYLLTSSCANFLLILYPLLTRIIFDGFQYPKTSMNEFYTCKLRFYALHTLDSISLMCICMATLDRYLISSRKVYLRQLSPTLHRTKQIIVICIVLLCFHNIPIGIYYKVSDFNECIISSPIYIYYYLWIVQIFLHGIFPMSFLLFFGFLTYKQLKLFFHPNRQLNINIDKQISRMLLLSCLSISISSVPYSIQYVYSVFYTEFNERLTSYKLLAYYISVLSFFSNAVLSFYIYLISTPNFRQQVKKICSGQVRFGGYANNRVNIIGSALNL
ncbi:unnamed protein product [Adineta ricciae]|uniref:G-protein coupled receptors family 1 profile domain-containing protein n=1 Tax=Adineta ricciae TaxID=249248 RepID=A0A815CEA4_ADIRI|nr:unnamed protein product [Adineta ricciae]CAF1439535.1 unnamed protein product [Adineta ricciae]